MTDNPVGTESIVDMSCRWGGIEVEAVKKILSGRRRAWIRVWGWKMKIVYAGEVGRKFIALRKIFGKTEKSTSD